MSLYSVVMRNLAGAPIQGDFELVQMGCAVAVAAFLPFTQLRNGNVFVDAFNLRNAGSEARIADTKNLTAAVDYWGGGTGGTLTFLGTSTVTGRVGDTTTIGTIKGGATGKTVTFVNDVNTAKVEYTGSGNIAMNGSLTGNVDASTGSAGTLVLSGTSTVSGTVGATNALTTINAGANGSTATFSSNVAATNLIFTGSGTVNMNGNFTGTTQLVGGGGILNVAAGKNVGAVTSTGNTGTVNFAGSTTIGGNLGSGASSLTAINFNGGTVTNAGY
jgi:hypothetical protein